MKKRISRNKLKRLLSTPKTNGLILWEGPSAIDGSPIVVIATGIGKPSSNAKTGDLIQTWILRSDISPTEASKLGFDFSICGHCPHRHFLGGSCYVQIFQAPRSVYASYVAGKYPKATDSDLEALARFGVRAGAYGDPAAAPLALWEALQPTTGYTHRWRDIDPRFAQWLMASADSESDRNLANDIGYRTFRVREMGAPLTLGEIDCPSEIVSCEDCQLCKGTRVGAKDIAIEVHGARKKRFTTLNVIQPVDHSKEIEGIKKEETETFLEEQETQRLEAIDQRMFEMLSYENYTEWDLYGR